MIDQQYFATIVDYMGFNLFKENNTKLQKVLKKQKTRFLIKTCVFFAKNELQKNELQKITFFTTLVLRDMYQSFNG